MVIALLAVRIRGHLPQLGRDVHNSKRTRGAATEPSEPIDGRGIRGPVDISVSAYATGSLRVVRNSRWRLVRVREQNRRDIVVPVSERDDRRFFGESAPPQIDFSRCTNRRRHHRSSRADPRDLHCFVRDLPCAVVGLGTVDD